MSSINYLEKLLDGVKVEWTTLGDEIFVEIANTGRKPVESSLRISGKVPYYGANNIQDYVEGYTHDGDFVLIAEDGAASVENYSIQYANGKFWANNHVHVVRGKSGLYTRFLYHYLQTVNFKPYLTGSGRAKLTKGKMLEIPIPIPCPENPTKSLEIQAEIVRILDSFTELTTELTAKLNAELAARKKQYSYYRDQLLSFEEGEVEWKTLGEVGEFIRGNGLQKKDFVESGFPAIHYGQIYTKYGLSAKKTFSYVSEELARKLRKANKNDLLLATTSENDEDVVKPLAWLGEEAAISGDMMLFRHKQNVKYLTYFFQTTVFQEQKGKYITGTKVRRVSSGDLAKIRIPLPSLAEQTRIVAILDKFDALANSISEGLPREIALRQQQYQYYRDLLLSFPKPEQVEA